MVLTIDQQFDRALEQYLAKRHAVAAAAFHELFRVMPETELRRDQVEFYLASSLSELGFAEAAVQHHVDIVTGRRSPDLVTRSLGALDDLTRRHLLDEGRLIDEVLFGNQFGDLPGETADFVEYHLGLGELRRGFTALGARRLEELSAGKKHYGWKARYALAVERLSHDNVEGADKLLRAILVEEGAPGDIKNDARGALARMLYEQKKYAEAFDLYSQIDAPLTSQDLVLVEKAWTKVADRDERRALGMVVGLGAPVYRKVFAPERSLITAIALQRLCQFRPAHLAVLEFRRRFHGSMERIRSHRPLADDPLLLQGALGRHDLIPLSPWRDQLQSEKARIRTLS